MSHPNTLEEARFERLLWKVVGMLLGLLALGVILILALLGRTPVAAQFDRALNALFALNTVQAMWYATRAAGLTAYLLLWLSTAWGLAVSSKIFDPFLQRAFTYDWHQFLSLLAILFTLAHIGVLLGDRYLPFSIAQILIPSTDSYRPLWVGIGILAFYLTLLVTVTFYLRRWIGVRTFRSIHLASFLAYLGATVHGFFAGTDSALLTTRVMYAVTALVIVFLTVYWLAMILLHRLGSLWHPASHGPAGQA